MDKAESDVLSVIFTFRWQLYLHSSESEPEAHFYLSTTHTDDLPTVIKLGAASGSRQVALRFKLTKEASQMSLAQIAAGCCFNTDIQVRTVNDYDERVPNPAGCDMCPLYELAWEKSWKGAARQIKFFQLRDPDLKVKGLTWIESPEIRGVSASIAVVSVGDKPLVKALHATPAMVEQAIARGRYVRRVCLAYIDAAGDIVTGLEPTIASVSNINSETYVTRAEGYGMGGIVPPVAFTMDVHEPTISVGFYANCFAIVRRRMGLSVKDIENLDIDGNENDMLTFSSFVGQLLCAYTSHSTYRTDFVWAYSASRSEFQKEFTENFGDVSVEEGSGDCEDAGKIIIRIYLGLLRLSKQGKLRPYPLLQKVASFLDCFVPLLFLMGVSSAQINAAPKDILHMGAHENAMLMPLAQFVDAIARFDANAHKWVKALEDMDATQRNNLIRSRRYVDIVLEGTGILEPIPSQETQVKYRLVLEDAMDQETFYAARRTYYYCEREGQTSFLKTGEKIFSPRPVLSGALFGSFLVTQRRPDTEGRNDIALCDAYTRSASFARFLQKDSSVALVMEPELNEAELVAIHEVLKDVHPPEPLGAPGEFNERIADKKTRADAVFSASVRPAWPWFKVFGDVEDMEPAPSKSVEQVYYVRVGKITKKSIDHLVDFFADLHKRGLVSEVHAYPEWITNNVGGYRLRVFCDIGNEEQAWKEREHYLGRKLPHQQQQSKRRA